MRLGTVGDRCLSFALINHQKHYHLTWQVHATLLAGFSLTVVVGRSNKISYKTRLCNSCEQIQKIVDTSNFICTHVNLILTTARCKKLSFFLLFWFGLTFLHIPRYNTANFSSIADNQTSAKRISFTELKFVGFLFILQNLLFISQTVKSDILVVEITSYGLIWRLIWG